MSIILAALLAATSPNNVADQVMAYTAERETVCRTWMQKDFSADVLIAYSNRNGLDSAGQVRLMIDCGMYARGAKYGYEVGSRTYY